MPVTRSGKKTGRYTSSIESDCEEDEIATKPSFNLSHFTKYSGTVNEDPDRFFMIFEHLANLQGLTNEKKVEILPMYLQDVALDLIFQLQSLNQFETLTYDQLKEKLVNLSRP